MVAQDLLRVALAQICQGAGFVRAQDAACDLLVDVVLKFIDTLGLVSRDTAELAGRTEVNFVDVHAALSELEVSVGSLAEFARDADEVPCARAVPAFPVKRKRVLITPDDQRAGAADAEGGAGAHVPAWFPPFPDRATYARTPVYAPRDADPQRARERLGKHRRDAEAAVVALARAAAAPSEPAADAEDEQLAAARAAPAEPGASAAGADAAGLPAALPSARLPAGRCGPQRAEAPRELLDAMREQDKRKRSGAAAAADAQADDG